MKTLFASGREYLSQDDWTVVSESGGTLTAGTYHFSLQAKNLIGRNYIIKKSITVSLNSEINITVLPTALRTNENWTTFIIGYSSTGLDSDYIQIGELRVKEIGNPSIQYQLPLSFKIKSNSELSILTVPDYALLLTNSNNVNKGSICYIEDLENYYQYVKDIYTEVDNTFILNSNENNYKWKYIQNPYCYLQSLSSSKGCNQEVRNYQEDFEFEGIVYTGDGSYSLELDYLILPEDTYSTKFIIDFGIFAGSLNLNDYFKNKVSYLVKGIYSNSNNILRTLTNSLENLVFLDYITWNNTKTDIEYITDSLTETEGFLISVKLKFYLDELLLNIPDNSYFRILPYLKTDISIYNSENYLSYAKGLLFYSTEGNYLRVFPNGEGLNLKVSKGLGVINGYSFPLTEETIVNSNLIPSNTKDIVLKINQNGLVFYNTSELTSNESIRAVISTEAVESDINILFSITGLTLTISHPQTSSGNLTRIREDYPDVIKGQLAYFNPTGFNLYIKNLENSEVKLFRYTGLPINLNLTWIEGETTTHIPVKEVIGFFQAKNIVSNLYDGSYLAGIAYTYDGSTVSAISHSPLLGCVLELPSQYSTSVEIEALLGTSAFKDTGLGIGNVIEIIDLGDGTEALPVLDGSQLTGIDKISTEYKNTNFNASTNTLYLVDTSAQVVTANLPITLEGKKITFADYAGTTYKNPTGFGRNSLILNSQGNLIQGQPSLEVDLENANVTVIFINNTWRLYTDFEQIQTSQTFDLTGSSLGFSGLYADLIGAPVIPVVPTLATVATTGLASDLIGLTQALPTFGEGAFLDTGDQPLNLVQLDSLGRLPQLDGRNLLYLPNSVVSPPSSKGDIWTHNLTEISKLTIGTMGQFLSVDLNEPTGLKWITLNTPLVVPYTIYETLSNNLTTTLNSHGKTYLISANRQITLTNLTENIEFIVRIIDGDYSVSLLLSNTALSPSGFTSISQKDKPIHLGYSVLNNVWFLTGYIG